VFPRSSAAEPQVPHPGPPVDGDQQAEIRRLEAKSAKVIAVGEGEVDWVIMEDPEGNGFSVLSPRVGT
jgi:hypothetical protein